MRTALKARPSNRLPQYSDRSPLMRKYSRIDRKIGTFCKVMPRRVAIYVVLLSEPPAQGFTARRSRQEQSRAPSPKEICLRSVPAISADGAIGSLGKRWLVGRRHGLSQGRRLLSGLDYRLNCTLSLLIWKLNLRVAERCNCSAAPFFRAKNTAEVQNTLRELKPMTLQNRFVARKARGGYIS